MVEIAPELRLCSANKIWTSRWYGDSEGHSVRIGLCEQSRETWAQFDWHLMRGIENHVRKGGWKEMMRAFNVRLKSLDLALQLMGSEKIFQQWERKKIKPTASWGLYTSLLLLIILQEEFLKLRAGRRYSNYYKDKQLWFNWDQIQVLFSSKACTCAVVPRNDLVRHCIKMNLKADLYWRRQGLGIGRAIGKVLQSLGRI